MPVILLGFQKQRAFECAAAKGVNGTKPVVIICTCFAVAAVFVLYSDDVDYAEDAYTAVSDPLIKAQMNKSVGYEVAPPSKERSSKLFLRFVWGALLSAALVAAWLLTRSR